MYLEYILDFYDWLYNIRDELMNEIDGEESREKCISIMTNIQNYVEKHGSDATILMMINVFKRETDRLDEEDEHGYDNAPDMIVTEDE